MSNAHQALREATHAWHQRVEKLPLFRQLLSPDLTEDNLRQTLTVLHDFYRQVEPAIQPYFPPTAQLPYLPKSTSLAADVTLLRGQIQPQFSCYEMTNAAAAWGARYVLEGAALGGQVIARHLQRTLPVTAANLQFYRATAEIAPPWQQFITSLSTELPTPAEIQKAATAAVDLFQLLHRLAH
jgi:heme oxygenase